MPHVDGRGERGRGRTAGSVEAEEERVSPGGGANAPGTEAPVPSNDGSTPAEALARDLPGMILSNDFLKSISSPA